MRTATTIFGEELVIDRRSAGASAQKNGALFENYTFNELSNYNIAIEKRPKFYCHYGLPRNGDFLVLTNDNNGDVKIHIECKQLGDVQSHFDKLSHCFMNLISGCYGYHFWLVYDFAKDSGNGPYKKMAKLKVEAARIKKLVALQGINFELIHIEDLPEVMKAYNIQKRY